MEILFTHPKYLYLLIIIPVFILVHFISLRFRGKNALKFANFEAISRVEGIDLFSKNLATLFLSSFIILLLVFAISGATILYLVESSSFSYVFVLDSSRSMSANDVFPNRFDYEKDVAKMFLDNLPEGAKAGVVSFSGSAIIEQPVTRDKDSIRRAITNVQRSQVEGTDMLEAIITSVNLIEQNDAGALFIMSDGQLNVGGVKELIDYALGKKVIIHTVPIGTLSGGQTDYGISKLNEDNLKALAYNSGGMFLSSNNKSELADLFRKSLEITKREVPRDISKELLIVAIALFIIQYFLINLRLRII